MTTHKDDKKVFERELEDYREQIWGCARCNWCQNQWGWSVKSAEFSEICPAFHEYRFFPYSGMGKMHIARAILEGDFDYEDAPELAEFIYTCTTCGACEMNCQRLQDKEPLKVNEALRARLVRDGIGPMPAHQTLIKSVKHYDNPWMQPRSQRDKWANKFSLNASLHPSSSNQNPKAATISVLHRLKQLFQSDNNRSPVLPFALENQNKPVLQNFYS